MLWILATSKWVDRYLSRLINWALPRWTTLNVQNYASLLRLSGDYTVMEMEVHNKGQRTKDSLKKRGGRPQCYNQRG